MSRTLPARMAAVTLTAWLMAAGTDPLGGQIFHRPRCSGPDCAENVFREEVERMTLTEGPLAYDRDERDLRELKQRIQSELAVDPVYCRVPPSKTMFAATLVAEPRLPLATPPLPIVPTERIPPPRVVTPW
jgi:hypothetical protein